MTRPHASRRSAVDRGHRAKWGVGGTLGRRQAGVWVGSREGKDGMGSQLRAGWDRSCRWDGPRYIGIDSKSFSSRSRVSASKDGKRPPSAVISSMSVSRYRTPW